MDWRKELTYNNNENEKSFVLSFLSRRVTHIFPEHYRVLSQRWHPLARATSHHVSIGPAAPFVSLSPSWGFVVAGQQWAQPHLRLRSTCCASWLFFHRTITSPAVSFGFSVPTQTSVSLSLVKSSILENNESPGGPMFPDYLCGKSKRKRKRVR